MFALPPFAIAQTDTLPAGVYNWSNSNVQKVGVLEKRQVLAGKTLDLRSIRNLYPYTSGWESLYSTPFRQ